MCLAVGRFWGSAAQDTRRSSARYLLGPLREGPQFIDTGSIVRSTRDASEPGPHCADRTFLHVVILRSRKAQRIGLRVEGKRGLDGHV